ncbi:MAG: hypothetical protein ACRDQ7_19590 [Haloechinothrix sp.]
MIGLALTAGIGVAGCGADTEQAGGDQTTGGFAVLPDAPAGSEQAGGTASMIRTDDATTVTVDLAGLEPNAEYVSHVHNQSCDQDSGGKHYQFEPGGSELPPNEIHLALNADADGKASATTEAGRKAGPEAISVVVHYQDAKVLCADL